MDVQPDPENDMAGSDGTAMVLTNRINPFRYGTGE